MTNQFNSGNAKRNYKDSLFRKVFADKKELLSLYNAVNATNYGNTEDLTVNTLDNAVYLNLKNDISFVFDFHLSLYEHQSTYSGNMPLRDLFYVSSLLQAEISEFSLYASKRVKIPSPIFVVFYNGMEEKPERWTEKLSSAFEIRMDKPKLELEVLMLNVNYGKNQELMAQCHTLAEYAAYVAKVRKYASIMEINEAVEQAVTESIEEGILTDFLSRYRAEAIMMSLLEYNEERDMKLMREAEREVGETEGIAKGEAKLIAIVRKKLRKGKVIAVIADELELDSSTIQQITDMITNNPTLDDIEIARLLSDCK